MNSNFTTNGRLTFPKLAKNLNFKVPLTNYKMEMERGVKRSLSESSTGSEDAGCDMPTVGFKVPKKQHLQQQPPDLALQRSYPTFQRRESQASTVSSVTSVSEDDELDGQQLSQVNVITHQPFQKIQFGSY